MSRLFISHSSTNNAEAVAIRDWLAEAGWNDVFLDLDPERGIKAGERWEGALTAAASRCEAVLFLISRAWLDSEWCLEEFHLARHLNKALFGVIIARDIGIEDLPDGLKGTWQMVNLTTGQDHRMFHVTLPRTHEEARVAFSQEGLVRLRRGLEKAGLDPRFFAWPPEDDRDRPPYRGLKPLESEDAGIFFGRDAPVVETLDRLRGLCGAAPPRVLVILGASGSGKSSFLRAGLLPRLARDDRDFLPLPVLRPERAALTGETGLVCVLEAALAAHGIAQARAGIRSAVTAGAERVRPLLQRLVDKAFAQALAEDGNAKPPAVVLAVDQAEELFLSDGLTEGEALLGLARDLATEDRPATIVLFTIRSDSYDRLETAKALEGVGQQTLPLLPMPRGAYQTVIEGPAARLGETGRKLAIDPRLTQRLLEDIEKGGGSDALPLLAFTLEQLYLDYGRGSGELRLADYEAFGGVKGAIEAAVERALAAADADPRIPRDHDARLALLRRGLIPWLAGIDPETGTPRRRIARLADVPSESAPLIRLLVEQRLLSTDRNERHEITIEPAHEALLRQWGLLRGWLEEDFAALTTLEGVKRSARDWTANAYRADWLNHSGTRLEEAEKFAARSDLAGDLSVEARDYLRRCREREEAERLEKENAQLGLQSANANMLAGLAASERLRGNSDTGLRLAVHAARLGLNFDTRLARVAPANAELAAGICQSGWSLLLTGHQGSVASVAFSSDGKRVVTASADRTARIWDAATGNQISALRGHDRGVMTAVFSPDDTRIVTASWDKTARIWDAATGMEMGALRGHGSEVTSAAFSPDGARIVTASADKTARIWDAATGKEIAALHGHEKWVTSAAFSPDGARIVTASADQTARMWEAATGKEIAALHGHENEVRSAVFSPDGTRIITASVDQTARIWDAVRGTEIGVLRGHEGWVFSAVFSPDGARIVTASADQTARIWNVATGKEIAALRGHGGWVTSATFSPDGMQVVIASTNQTARIWDVATAKVIAVLRGHGVGASAVPGWQESEVRSALFSPEGTRIVTASADQTARIWDAATGKLIAVLRGHEGYATSAVFSPNAAQVVTASVDKTARIWDAVTGKPIAVLRGHDGHVNSATFSPDGERVVTGSADQTARVWDAVTGKLIAVLRGHEGHVNFAAFSPDGTRIVTASVDQTAQTWDAVTGEPIAVLRGHEEWITSAAFNPDGTRIVTASADQTARIWDGATGKQIAVLQGHGSEVMSAVFSPDGAQIATASVDQTARIWDVATGKEIAALRGHEKWVASAAFSPDGTRVVTASADQTARIWDAATGKEIGVLRGHENGVRSAVFSPDGTRVVTASADQTARIWDVRFATMPTRELIAEACMRRLRGMSKLTRDEMRLAGYPEDVPEIDVCEGVE